MRSVRKTFRTRLVPFRVGVIREKVVLSVTKTEEMIERAKKVAGSVEERERQRLSFAYGNAKTENDLVTWEMVEKAAEKHKKA